MARAGKNSNLYVPSELVSFTNEETSSVDNITYQIDDIQKRVWCRFCDITVLDGGIPTTESFTLNRLVGKVIFDTADTRDITVTGQYYPMIQLLQAFEFDLSLTADNQEVPVFTEGWQRRIQGLKDISGSLSRYFIADGLISGVIDNDEDFVIRFYSKYDLASPEDFDFIAWVKVDGLAIASAVDGVVDEDIDFEGTHDADGRVVSRQ